MLFCVLFVCHKYSISRLPAVRPVLFRRCSLLVTYPISNMSVPICILCNTCTVWCFGGPACTACVIAIRLQPTSLTLVRIKINENPYRFSGFTTRSDVTSIIGPFMRIFVGNATKSRRIFWIQVLGYQNVKKTLQVLCGMKWNIMNFGPKN